MKYGKLILAILCSSALFSCTDKAWEGITDDQYDDLDMGVPVPVVISMGSLQNGYTKGTGAVDAEDGKLWKDVDVYVYAFKKDAESYSYPASENNPNTLVDASLDDPESTLGRKAIYEGVDGYITWENAKQNVYYPLGKEPYDFFAYYLDDAEVDASSVTRTGTSVSFPVEIDGSRDLMTAHAEFSRDQVAGRGFTDDDIRMLEKYSFSSWTARRNVNPVLQFKHHLTRLRFEIYPGLPGSNEVYVNEVRVKSKTAAEFTVASSDPSLMGLDFEASSTRSDLFLCEQDGSPLKQNTYHTQYEGDFSLPIFERQGVQVGGTILVAPDTSYEIAIANYETNTGKVVHPLPFTISLAEGFKPGHQYVVKMAIYEMMSVDITVDVEPWGTGGYIILDQEDEYY